MKVLSTKTLNENALEYARSLQIEVACVDFIQTKKVPFLLPEKKYDALVFTSENAVNAFVEHLEKTAFFAVFSLSGKTNEALLKHNIQANFMADNAEALAEKIAQSNVKSVFHICGNLVLDILEKRLENAGISYEKRIVYETEKTHQKGDFSAFSAILFFSPSGVDSFFSVNEIAENTVCVAIGKTTAEAIKLFTSNPIIIAEKPNTAAMFDALRHLIVKQ